jgi:Flp pilus assembly protein TadD
MCDYIKKGVFSVLAVIFIVSGCSSMVQVPVRKAYSLELEAALTGRPILGRDFVVEDLPNFDLFALSPEMMTFAELSVKSAATPFQKVKALHHALLLPANAGGLGISYNALSTQVPVSTFQQRQANCLSYTLLYVALARHLGLNAYVNDVEIPPTWGLRTQGSFLFLHHVNVIVLAPRDNELKQSSDHIVIDLEMSRYKSTYPQHFISDQIAAAQFYSNSGMEKAAEGNMKEAFLYLRKALQEDDRQSYLWNNLGSIFQRENNLREAEVIYLHGLSLNKQDLPIMNNLSRLYKTMGNKKQEAIFYKLAEQYRQSNPYYYYSIALSAFEGGDYDQALHFVKHAIERDKKEPRFYQLAASVYEQLGQLSMTESMNKKYNALVK